MNRGLLIVLSGPSGVGKGTILKKVLNSDPNLVLSISATTRKKRPGEIDGVNYHFIEFNKFKEMITNNELLEYAIVYDNYYGTVKSITLNQLDKGRDVILEIDTIGAENIKKMFPNALTIFLIPPDRNILIERLKGRGTETDEIFKKRIDAATEELEKAKQYDYIILNDDASICAKEVINIIKKEKLNINNRRQQNVN